MEHEEKDLEFQKAAKRRAAFRTHLLIYFIMNLFFWTIWYIRLKNTANPPTEINTIPWPVWPLVIWGIGVYYHYHMVYRNRKGVAEKGI